MLDQGRNAPGAAFTAYPDVSSSSSTTAPRVKTTRSSSPPTSRTAPQPANTPSNATEPTRPSGVFSRKTPPTSRSKSPRPPCPIRSSGRLWEEPNQEKLKVESARTNGTGRRSLHPPAHYPPARSWRQPGAGLPSGRKE
jgi:hypothetical protein